MNGYIKFDKEGKFIDLNKNAKKILKIKKENHKLKRIYNIIHQDFILEFINNLEKLKLNKIKKFEMNVSLYDYLYNELFASLEIFQKEDFFVMRFYKKPPQENIKKKIIDINKINLIFRNKFVIGSIIPFLFSIFWVYYKDNNFNVLNSILIFISIYLLHVSANTFNDYFDWISGRDKKNLDYVLFSTGGSRALDFKLISESNLLKLSLINLLLVSFIGVYFIYIKGVKILLIGLFAIFVIYFYSAPPIHLASRYGLGELMHIIALGPMIVYGSCEILSENSNYVDFIIGLPFGILITGCLLINEYADSKYDEMCGKNNLAVLLKENISYLYVFLILLAYLIFLTLILLIGLPKNFILIFLNMPYNIISFKYLFNLKKRYCIIKSCIVSFNIYLYFSISLILLTIINSLNPW